MNGEKSCDPSPEDGKHCSSETKKLVLQGMQAQPNPNPRIDLIDSVAGFVLRVLLCGREETTVAARPNLRLHDHGRFE